MNQMNGLLVFKKGKLKTDAEIKKLVIARLATIPPNRKISIGCYGELSGEEAIDHVRMDDEIGKKFIEIEMEYLQTLKDGVFTF